MPFVVASGSARGGPVFTTRSVRAVLPYGLDRWRQLPHLALSVGRVPFSVLRLRLAVRRLGGGQPVLVIGLVGSLGDVVAGEPVARWARREFPNRKILWVTQRPYAPLVRTFPAVDSVFPVSCLTEWAFMWRVSRLEAVWDLHVSGKGCDRCGLVVAKDDHLPGPKNYLNWPSLLGGQCELAGIPWIADGPRLATPPRARQAIDRLDLPHRYVVIHGSSSNPRKDWVRERWAELVRRVGADLRTPVIEVGTAPLLAGSGALFRSLSGRLSILETAEVIRRAALFVGVDSGPAHLANAVGTPGVILLGKLIHFDRYMPYSGGYADGSNAEILYAEGPAAELSVERVMAAVSCALAAKTGDRVGDRALGPLF